MDESFIQSSLDWPLFFFFFFLNTYKGFLVRWSSTLFQILWMNDYFSFTSVSESQSLYMNLFITSMCLVWTCGSSTEEIILPRLEYIGEFLFTSPKQGKMNLLCSLSGARLHTTSVECFPLNFRPCTKLLWWLDLIYGFALHNLFPSKVWTIGLILLFIRPCIEIGRASCRERV